MLYWHQRAGDNLESSGSLLVAERWLWQLRMVEPDRGGCDELEGVVGLLLAGFDDGQQCLNEVTSLETLGAEGGFVPDDGRAKKPFADVVCGFDRLVIEGRLQPVAVL